MVNLNVDMNVPLVDNEFLSHSSAYVQGSTLFSDGKTKIMREGEKLANDSLSDFQWEKINPDRECCIN